MPDKISSPLVCTSKSTKYSSRPAPLDHPFHFDRRFFKFTVVLFNVQEFAVE